LLPDDCRVELNSVFFNPEQLMIAAEMIHKIHEAVQSLPARCSLIFKLIKEEGLKYREAAELLNLSLKPLKTR
jgi:RNA polymerase sigma-70 factor (ECF subfamily)